MPTTIEAPPRNRVVTYITDTDLAEIDRIAEKVEASRAHVVRELILAGLWTSGE